MEKARQAEASAVETAASMQEKVHAAAAQVAALSKQIEEGQEVVDQKNARIKRLEEVRLTKDQVDKLQAMKISARNTAAENKALKQRLSAVEAHGSASGSGTINEAQAAADAERIAELEGAKGSLLEKLRQYGKRVHELEKERVRVRAALEQTGVSAREGRDLGDAVLEVAERSLGPDESMTGSFSAGSGAAAAAAVASSERYIAELEEARMALQREEADRAALQEQMRAGVIKYRALEEKEAEVRNRVEAMEAEQREAVSVAVKAREKDHERKLKFLQVKRVR